MSKLDVKDVRNVGLVGHGGSGKTSLVEHILNKTGKTSRAGTIAAGNTVGDYLEEEVQRKFTISLKLTHTDFKKTRIYIVDNPGYADFVAEMVASLAVLDSAILLVDGFAGIEVGTISSWRYCDEYKLPRAVFVNKLDKEHSDFYRVLASLQEGFSGSFIPFTIPVGKQTGLKGVVSLWKTADAAQLPEEVSAEFSEYREKLVEAAADADDELTEKYLEEGTLSEEEIARGLKKGIAARTIVPVLCGAGEKGAGVEELLEFVVDCLPSPLDVPTRKAKNAKGEEVELKPDPAAPLAAYVFKTMTDPYIGQLTYFRVYSGTVRADVGFYNANKETQERISNLFIMEGKEQTSVASVGPGEVAAVPKLKITAAGDTLCDQAHPYKVDPIVFPEPMVRLSVKPRSRADEDKIMTALNRIAEEDPTFKAYRNRETKEDIIAGMGDLHLNVIMDRLKNKFNVSADTALPTVPYKEAIKGKASARYRHKKQTGGRGQFGEVELEISPRGRGEGFEFVDNIVGGVISKNFIPSVEKGVVEALERGILAGFQVVDVKVRLYDGMMHTVDSSDLAFKLAGSMALQKAASQIEMCLLEPIMEVEVVVPEEYMGDITGIFNSKRGRILGMEPGSYGQVIRVLVPEAEMLNYSAELRSITGGRGTYTMKFSRYEEVPSHIAQKIIEQAKKQKEEGEK
ncbi:MAG: elongation factor G [Candidatus Abyssobacteria bacterium SURF_17]|uniref:Elongation factor G n=1 Tax=Candidatus Abyssobacteria bacterium SURF_17 TaxID=2093361 RepID=A0A419F8H7_9BACT|nr:MAG: elongation factor G [Candidatus Abyssubacteria bacterium SURF_17]